jgi:LysR family transcriptional regulator, glycine cleavage system transcriptional activator
LRRIPPLGTIEAFVVGSRERSFRAAAERLALSPSAFSRRIQLLETFVGTALFDRSGTVPVLTSAGERYLRDLEPAVDVIRRGTDALRANYRRGPLRISASLSVATTWLLPRLRRFLDWRADIPVVVVTGDRADRLRSGEADLSIIGDTAAPEVFPSELLITPAAVPLAAPEWVERHGVPTSVDDLCRHRLLAAARPARTWHKWSEAIGHGKPIPVSGEHYETVVMTYEAAAAGLGVALGAPLAAERFVSEGRLVRCFSQSAPIGASYFLAFADKATRQRDDVACFATWLKGEADASGAAFDAAIA